MNDHFEYVHQAAIRTEAEGFPTWFAVLQPSMPFVVAAFPDLVNLDLHQPLSVSDFNVLATEWGSDFLGEIQEDFEGEDRSLFFFKESDLGGCSPSTLVLHSLEGRLLDQIGMDEDMVEVLPCVIEPHEYLDPDRDLILVKVRKCVSESAFRLVS